MEHAEDGTCVKESAVSDLQQEVVSPNKLGARSSTIEIRAGGAGAGANSGRGGRGGGGAGAANGRAGAAGRQVARDDGGFKIEFELPALDGHDLHARAVPAAATGKSGRSNKRR